MAGPTRTRHLRGWVWGGSAAAALAAAATLAVVLLPPGPSQAPISAELSAASAGSLTLGDTLHLEYEGAGTVRGTEAAPVLEWERGTVRVELQPGSGRTVTVETRDASITVTGTVFTVARGALGTQVGVERGTVEVRCEDRPPEPVGAGGQAECAPTTAGGLLGRARALAAADAPPTQILDATQAGQARAVPGSAIAAELAVLELHLLEASDRPGEALDRALHYLDQGATLRREAVAATALRLAHTLDRCAELHATIGPLAPGTVPEGCSAP